MEFCGHKEFPKIGLQIVFPEALFPFAVICKNEVWHFVLISVLVCLIVWKRFSWIINNYRCTLGSCRWHFLLSSHICFMPWQCLGLPTLLNLKKPPIMYLAPICNLMTSLSLTLWAILIKDQQQQWQEWQNWWLLEEVMDRLGASSLASLTNELQVSNPCKIFLQFVFYAFWMSFGK